MTQSQSSATLVAGVLLLVALGTRAQAQAMGSEFRVNVVTQYDQYSPDVAATADGRFVVVWTSGISGYNEVLARRFDTVGPVGGAFQVNTYVTGGQQSPSVASAANGTFVVVWESTGGQDGSQSGVYGQRYDAAGARVGLEFRVNSYTVSSQADPSVASADDGSFVVVWSSNGQDGSSWGVFARRFGTNGYPVGDEFRVNSYTVSEQRFPSVASAADGRFVVVWRSLPQDGDLGGVFAQRYDVNAVAVGPEFRVNVATQTSQTQPDVAAAADGRFVVVWTSAHQGSNYEVFRRRYDPDGAPLGPEFRVNSYTTGLQGYPAIALVPDGRFLVVWRSLQDTDIFGQLYDATGPAVGSEFRINSYTTADQRNPSVAAATGGRFVATWQSNGQDGYGLGVYGQRLADDLIFRDGFETGPGP